MTATSDIVEPAIIEVSSLDATVSNRKISGTIEEHLQKSLTIATGEEIPTSAEVKVQSKSLLFSGKVVKCLADSERNWRIHIRVTRAFLVV